MGNTDHAGEVGRRRATRVMHAFRPSTGKISTLVKECRPARDCIHSHATSPMMHARARTKSPNDALVALHLSIVDDAVACCLSLSRLDRLVHTTPTTVAIKE